MDYPDQRVQDEHRWVVHIHYAVLAAKVLLDHLLLEIDVRLISPMSSQMGTDMQPGKASTEWM